MKPTELICEFIVPGYCQPKQRTFGNRFNTPPETRAYEKAVAQLAKIAMQGKGPYGGFVGLEIEIICEVPKSWTKKKRAWALEGKCFPTHCDASNSLKALEDGMNKIVYIDDRFINSIVLRREYGPEEHARVRAVGMMR